LNARAEVFGCVVYGRVKEKKVELVIGVALIEALRVSSWYLVNVHSLRVGDVGEP
jgi:hypothetical protein